MKFTVDMIESYGPCAGYIHGLIVSLIGDGKTEKEIVGMDIPIEDRIWALIHGLSPRDQRLFACDCADRPHLLPHQSSEAKEAIRLSRLYAVGGATDKAADWATDKAAYRAAEREWQLEALLGYYQEEGK